MGATARRPLERQVIRSKCINCRKQRSCIKIEARQPLKHGPVLVWNNARATHEKVEYEIGGPMVEICRKCLQSDIGTLAHYLVGQL